MRRTSRDNALCSKSLEQALAKYPERYQRINLLCAGWPCQGNSIAGSRKGLDCKRSGLWKEVARCLRIFKPKWFFGENVCGLLSVNECRDFLKVIADLQEIGYGVAWNVFDSQWFGVAQRRKRVFIVGCLGDICPPEILFEPKGNKRNYKKKQKMGYRGLCISTRDGERQNPTQETYIASTIGAYEGRKNHPTTETHIASTIRANDYQCGHRGFEKSNLITEINPKRKRETSRASHKLDSVRGIVIGNAVTVNVAKWIAKRIYDYERNGNK